MNNCTISVIIPTYNRKDTVVQAINSVLRQTFQNYEIIVIDDGSTDGTAEVIKKLNCDRLRYYYQPNGGVSSARNFGLKKAYGQSVCFLDSDDLYTDKALEYFDLAFQKFPDAAIAYGKYSGKSCCANEMAFPDIVLRDVYPLLVYRNLVSSNVAVKSDVARKVQYRDELPTIEDYQFALDVARDRAAVYIDAAIFEYRFLGSNKSSKYISNGVYCVVMDRIIEREISRLSTSQRKDKALLIDRWLERKNYLTLLQLAIQENRQACENLIQSLDRIEFELCCDMRYVLYRIIDVHKRITVLTILMETLESNPRLEMDNGSRRLKFALVDAAFVAIRFIPIKRRFITGLRLRRLLPDYVSLKKLAFSLFLYPRKW